MRSVLQGAAAFLAVAGASFQFDAWSLRWRIGTGGELTAVAITVALLVVVLAIRYRGAVTAAGCGLCWTLAALVAAGADWLWAGALPTSAILAGSVVLPLALLGAGFASFGGSGRGGAVAGALLGLAAAELALELAPMTAASTHRAALVCWLGGALFCQGWRRPVAGYEVDWHGAGPAACAGMVATLVLLQRDELMLPVWTGAFHVQLCVLALGAVFGAVLRVPPAWSAAVAAGVLILTLDRHGPNDVVWVAVGTWIPLLLAGATAGGVARRAAPLSVPVTLACVAILAVDAVADATPLAAGYWDPTPALALVALVLLARRSFAPLAIALFVAPVLTLGGAGGVQPWEQDAVAGAAPIADLRAVERTRDRGVFWNPDRQSLEVRIAGETWDRWGPGVPDSVLLGTLPLVCRATDAPVILLGADGGRVGAAVAEWGLEVLSQPLGPTLQGIPDALRGMDGPGPDAGRVGERHIPWSALWNGNSVREALRTHATAASQDRAGLLTFGAPIPGSRRDLLTEEFHRLARSAVGPEGIVAFAVRLDTHPAEALEAILGAAHRGHGRIRTFLRAGTLVVIGGASTDVGAGRWSNIPEAAKASLHSVGVTTAEDVRGLEIDLPTSRYSILRDQDVTTSPRSGGDAVVNASDGLAWLATQATVPLQVERLRFLAGSGPRPRAGGSDPRSTLAWQEGVEQEAARVARLAQREGEPAAPFARALADRAHGVAELVLLEAVADPRGRARPLASAWEIAAALDPSVGARASWLAADAVPPGPVPASPLGDYARWPAGDDLVGPATGDDPLAHCLRARLRSRCVRAFAERLATAELSQEEAAAFRHALDPWGVDRAWGNVVAARGLDAAVREVLPLVRRDLPWPEAVDAVLQGPVPGRVRLAEALGGRTDPRSLALLAALLEDGDREVRTAAGASLFRWAGRDISYDPEWNATRRRSAADAVRQRIQETANDDED